MSMPTRTITHIPPPHSGQCGHCRFAHEKMATKLDVQRSEQPSLHNQRKNKIIIIYGTLTESRLYDWLHFLAVQNSSIGLIVRPAPLTIRVLTTLQSDPRDL